MYSIVTNFKIVNYFKRSEHFKVNLGMVSTLVDKTGQRRNNENDKFAFYYNNLYNTHIYAQGHIGDILFYLDHYIKDDVLAVYINHEEFIFKFDQSLMIEKGPNFYLGNILKELNEQNEERVRKAEEDKLKKEERKGNPDSLIQNPGAVSYADIQAYLDKKRKERYSTGN
jgi:hypothetical protein